MTEQSVETQLALMRLEITNLTDELHELRTQQTLMMTMVDRWKGGFLVIVALGGIAGFILSLWDKVTSKWH